MTKINAKLVYETPLCMGQGTHLHVVIWLLMSMKMWILYSPLDLNMRPLFEESCVLSHFSHSSYTLLMRPPCLLRQGTFLHTMIGLLKSTKVYILYPTLDLDLSPLRREQILLTIRTMRSWWNEILLTSSEVIFQHFIKTHKQFVNFPYLWLERHMHLGELVLIYHTMQF